MEYREIVAVTGIGGLFQLLATKSDGAIVRNLADKTTKFISARLHNVTPLESIEIYTTGDNVRLHDVLQKMKDSDGSTKVLDGKSASDNKAVKEYFQSVYPELDEDRVYVSDMKKILKWYELLKANDLLNFEKLQQAETTEEAETEEKPAKKDAAKQTDAEETATEEEKPAKKTTKKAAAKTEDGEEKPAKKAAPKKAAAKKSADEDGEEKPAKKTAKKKSEE
jgi:septal ring factor EnvC (AmiA/AmiB activator)